MGVLTTMHASSTFCWLADSLLLPNGSSTTETERSTSACAFTYLFASCNVTVYVLRTWYQVYARWRGTSEVDILQSQHATACLCTEDNISKWPRGSASNSQSALTRCASAMSPTRKQYPWALTLQSAIWRPLFIVWHLVLLIRQKGNQSNHANSPSHDLKHIIKHSNSSPCGPTHTCPWVARGCAQPQLYFCHQCPDQAPHTEIPTLRGTCTIIHTEKVGLTLPVLTSRQLPRHSIMT